MQSLYLLIPIAMVIVAVAIAVFFWAVKSGQYDDLDTEASRILFDQDDVPVRTSANESQHHDAVQNYNEPQNHDLSQSHKVSRDSTQALCASKKPLETGANSYSQSDQPSQSDEVKS